MTLQSRKGAVFGLGSMGYGIAGSILRAGHVTYGFDVRAIAVDQFRADGGALCGTWRGLSGYADFWRGTAGG